MSRFVLAAVVCVLLPAADAAAKSDPPRENGALYVADFSARPCHLRIVSDAPVYAGADGRKTLSVKLPPGQAVELVAVSEYNDLLCVREDGSPGGTPAWVPKRCVTPLDPSLATVIKTRLARRRQVRTLAARNEIALNMTRREVVDILDKPFKQISGTSDGLETWEYPFYIGVPRQASRSFYSRFASVTQSSTVVLQDRIQAGTILVTFTKNLVSAIEYRDVPGLKRGTTTKNTVSPPVVLR